MSINETPKDTLLLPFRLPKKEKVNENVRACSIKPVTQAAKKGVMGLFA
jgi:hypothetical protein